MPTVDVISFEIEGFDDVINAIKQLPDKIKHREVIKILKRQAKPTQRVMIAQAPRIKDGRTMKYHRKKSIEYRPGNLKRSIKMFSRGPDYPTVFVGAQAKKPEGSGYYSSFIQYGTNNGKRGIRRKNDFVKRTDDMVSDIMGDNASGELVKYITKEAKKLNFQVV